MLSVLQHKTIGHTDIHPQPTQETIDSVSFHCSQTASTVSGKRSGFLHTYEYLLQWIIHNDHCNKAIQLLCITIRVFHNIRIYTYTIKYCMNIITMNIASDLKNNSFNVVFTSMFKIR